MSNIELSDVAKVLEDHFSLFPISTDPEEANRMSVRRKYVWTDAIRAMTRSSFNCRKSVRITFVSEEGVDDGGPRREFFHLAIKAMADDHTIFHGPENRLLRA